MSFLILTCWMRLTAKQASGRNHVSGSLTQICLSQANVSLHHLTLHSISAVPIFASALDLPEE